MKLVQSLVLVCLAGVYSSQAFAEIKIDNAWIRLLPPVAQSTAAYLDIVSSEEDALVGVKSSVAMMNELHQSSMENGVMSMDHVDRIVLPKGKKVSLKPGGYHVMLMRLMSPLEEGKEYQLTLSFEKAGDIDVNFPVKP